MSKKGQTKKLGRYEIVGGSLGSGVLRAWDPELEREVALKKVEDLAAARSEARALAACGGHESIPEVYDVLSARAATYVVMERIHGRTLGDDEKGKKRGEAEAVELTMNVLRALRHMHGRRYLHTDVKPRNIIVQAGGESAVKLVDFGGAAKMNAKRRFVGKSLAGFPPYMPPEQFDEPASLDESADVYQAAGVCVYLLTGKPPIDVPNVPDEDYYPACRTLHERGRMRPLTNKGLECVLARALAPAPGKRFRKAQDLIDALRPFAPSLEADTRNLAQHAGA